MADYKIDYLRFVYDDPVVSAGVLRQKPFIVMNPASRPSVCIKHLVNKIENTDLVFAISDMYLPSFFITKILKREGFSKLSFQGNFILQREAHGPL